MLKPGGGGGGGLGTYIGDVNIRGGVQVRRQIWLYGACSYYGEGGGVLGQTLDMLIL